MGIDAVVGSQSEYIFQFTNNMVGIVFSLIMLTAYERKEIFRPVNILWSVAGILMTVFGYIYWYQNQAGHFLAKCVMVPFNIWVLGLVVNIFARKAFINKKISIRPSLWEYAFILCMLLMTFSKNEAVWPLYYGIVFFLLLHTPFSDSDKKELLSGALDGIVLGFFLIQGFAYYNRPYDDVRYIGSYGDCNRNGCMYLVTMAAFLGKAFLQRAAKCDERNLEGGSDIKKGLRISKASIFAAIDCIMAAGIFTFILFTGCRSAIVGLAIMLPVFLFAEWRVLKEKLFIILIRFACCIMLLIPMIPLVYATIRYIPAICDHPIYYGAEWNEEKVQPRSAVDDWRYVTLDESVDMIYERFFVPARVSEALRNYLTRDFANPFVMKVFAADLSDAVPDAGSTGGADGSVPEDHSDEYMVSYVNVDDLNGEPEVFYVPKKVYTGVFTVDVRINIALTLLRDINLTGHTSAEGHYRITSDNPGAPVTWSHNPQNLIVYMIYSYGLIAGIFGLLLYLGGLIMLMVKADAGNRGAMVALIFWLIHLGMGITEVVWIPGQIILVMLFFTAVICYNKPRVRN